MKLLLGGSPCTHWSIAQTKNRETEPSGIGWELFKNYKIALEKFQPDYFLYENNKSMSAAIREQITKELGVEPIHINSALVSAQNRQRLYWTNIPGVEQPEDRGILLRDILDTGEAWREKAYTLDAHYYKTAGLYDPTKQHSYSRLMAAEPVGIAINTCGEKSHTLKAQYFKNGIANFITNGGYDATAIAEPVRIGTIESDAKNADFDSQQYRVYSPDGKSVTLCGNGGGVGAKTGLYAVPYAGRIVGRRINEQGHRDDYNEAIPHFQYFEVNENPQKTNCLTTVQKDNMIAEPVEPKIVRSVPVYEVRNGLITIKDKQYPIKLRDGFYIIRKLTVTECKRLQTVPDDYIFPVSNSQAYKMLGNGWTVDVIAHILSYAPGITEAPLEVLSMYDGMSCGHIALDKLGANVERYYATEIDKYAIQTTQTNYPDTIQLGDAFQVRDENWRTPDSEKAVEV